MNKNKMNIIIIDDEIEIIDVLKAKLKEYDVAGYTSSNDAIMAIKKGTFDMLILDYFVDDLNGAEIVKKIRMFDNDIYILVLTGFSQDIPGLKVLDEMDVQSYVEKGEFDKIIVNIKTAIKSIDFMRKDKKSDVTNFAKRLKELRRSFNASQEDLAKYLGVGRTTITNYERGFNMPSVDVLENLAKYFGVSIDYLMCYKIGLPYGIKKKSE